MKLTKLKANMKYSPIDYAHILFESGDANALVDLLKKHWVLSWLPQVTVTYERLVRDAQKIKDVTVSSAHPLDATTKQHIEQLLAAHYPQGVLDLNFDIDKTMLGGFRAQSDQLIIQGSLLDQLHQLFS